MEVAAPAAAKPARPAPPPAALTEDILYQLLVAEFAGQRGRLDVSVENYLELAQRTRDHRIAERAARIAVYARDDAAAMTAALLWTELAPHNPDAHQVLAVMHLRTGNLEQAGRSLQDVFAYSDGEIDQKLWMTANMLEHEKDGAAVMAVMENLVAALGDSPAARYAFAHVAATLGHLERSLELLEGTLPLAPDNNDVALSYVSILQRLEREQEALAWLKRQLAERNGENFPLRMAYARLLMDAERYEEARDQFETLTARFPENIDALYLLGLLYLRDNRLDDSAVLFKKLSTREELTDAANYYLGRIAEEQQDYDQAGSWYQGVHQGKHYFDAQVRLALLLAKDGKIEAARDHLGSIQTQGERQAQTLVQAEGDLLMREQRYADAYAVYSRGIENAYNADLLYARAMAAERLGRLGDLETDLRAIIEREPEHAQALNALGYTLADATDRHEEAYDLIERALALAPTDFHILDSMGWVLYRLGRLDEAIDYLQRAMALRPDPEIAAHLGEVLWVSGDRNQAREVWEAALEQRPEHARLLDVMRRFNP